MVESQPSNRLKLTLWYTLATGVILALFTILVYTQTQSSLEAEADAAAERFAAAVGAHIVNDGGRLGLSADAAPALAALPGDMDAKLIQPDGLSFLPLGQGTAPIFSEAGDTARTATIDGVTWRFHTQPVTAGSASGSIQIATSAMDGVLDGLRQDLLLGLGMALILAAVAGYVLSGMR